ncbi:MAG: GNAT family N-acetyltransferase, partial [Pseudomonadota bacterium]
MTKSRPACAIRDAAPDEAPEIAGLLITSITALCAADHNDDPAEIAAWTANKTAENVRRWIGAPGMVALVALRQGRCAGVAMGDASGATRLIYAAPEHRFTGVSDALLARLEASLAAAGASVGRLRTTRTAREFYLARGW